MLIDSWIQIVVRSKTAPIAMRAAGEMLNHLATGFISGTRRPAKIPNPHNDNQPTMYLKLSFWRRASRYTDTAKIKPAAAANTTCPTSADIPTIYAIVAMLQRWSVDGYEIER